MDGDQSDRRPDAFLASVGRAMTILERLAEGERSLSDIARELEVNKNIAHRLIFTLEELGFIQEEPQTREFRLTYKLLNLARTQWLSSDVLSQAEPILKALARETGELVRLAVVDGGQLKWIFAETGARRSLMISPAYGGNIIPHVHATSKAYLLTLSEAELEREISLMSFEAFSPYTITNADSFRKHIRESRRKGFAVSYEERDIGVAAVAAPVMAGRSKAKSCVAVVSVSIPVPRLPRDQIEVIATKMLIPSVRKVEKIWPV